MLSKSTSQVNNTVVEKCISLLRSCASSPSKLTQIHGFAIRRGVSLADADMAKHLIFAAVNLSIPMQYSHTVFSLVEIPNIFAWNTMIRGYAESRYPSPAVELYRRMRASPTTQPDTHSFPFVLKAVAKLRDFVEGEKIHSVCVKNGFDSLVFVQNALVHMYACCGRSESARQVFDEMPLRDLVAWNTVINAFSLNGKPIEALVLFREMSRSENLAVDGFTMVSLLSASAELGDLGSGRRAHGFIIKSGLDSNVITVNALLDLYAKCGSAEEAKSLFHEMKEKSVVTWSSLIAGLAANGFGEEALEYFNEFEARRLVPSEATFVGVLYACAQCGFVERGLGYFRKMREVYGIAPGLEHHGCVVDLLGRAGLVHKAHEFIREMDVSPNSVIWRTLLGACTLHGESVLAEVARAQLGQGHSGDYMLLSNLYASKSRWSEAQGVRSAMHSHRVWKTPSTSSQIR